MTNRKASWKGMNWIRQVKRFAIYHRDGFACVYCSTGSEDGTGLSLDHVLAHELGGTNEESNLVTSCSHCNSAKAHRTVRAWLLYLRHRGVNTTGLAARIRKQTHIVLARLKGILLFHVLPRNLSAAAVGKMRDGDKVKTVSGKEFTLGLKNNVVTVNGAIVSKTDIQASNGVIHAIDTVIMPN